LPVERVYWDSDCFLGWLQAEPSKVELCEGTLERANQGDVLIFTSTLTMAEVLWLKGGPPIPQQKADLVRRFFRRSYMRLRNVTRTVSESAQELVWNNGVRPKDAIHVATALEAKANAFETFDEALLKKSGTIGRPALIVRKPIPPTAPRLL
jgi:predicted nucleic acid-binding protein